MHKAFAGRMRDWLDIEGVLVVSGRNMRWQIVRDELPPLLELKGEPEAMDKLQRRSHERRLPAG